MKQIKLSQGKIALVDDEDFEYLNQWKWHISGSKYSYACRNIPKGDGKRKKILMHRQILGLLNVKTFCDHRDHNTLNNQKNNLRVATRSQNAANRIPFGSSKYLGVHLVVFKKSGRRKKSYSYWRATINEGKEIKLLGLFHNELDAALAYNKKAIELHGEFANLNIIKQ